MQKPRLQVLTDNSHSLSIALNLLKRFSYVSNLQNIQNMMGDVTSGIDFVKQHVLVYLDWSDPKCTLNILHAAVISSIGLALIGPFIPWRLVLLISGEAMFILNHPWIQVWLAQLKSASSSV
ncbi:hypothetical protein PGTUg99_020816 [Puccinia graminis f. sp. tritici]|uniref:TECPR1-like DysF domain-containing protein n=1 Tax=Puccinia graminis f. sp. tritici TaxID=56615 RepID=A0A5B0NHJ3_PUCGR|nr:hypothetical protein PGTUg99_020816 [Puccinia graminis f. sp. tritici]